MKLNILLFLFLSVAVLQATGAFDEANDFYLNLLSKLDKDSMRPKQYKELSRKQKSQNNFDSPFASEMKEIVQDLDRETKELNDVIKSNTIQLRDYLDEITNDLERNTIKLRDDLERNTIKLRDDLNEITRKQSIQNDQLRIQNDQLLERLQSSYR
jgi:hypothetical protein